MMESNINKQLFSESNEVDNLKKLKDYKHQDRSKIINDPLHGHIDFSKGIFLFFLKIINFFLQI